jgi:hypothetical protein
VVRPADLAARDRGRRLFTLGWLVEWRLIFPTLPALLLALAIAALPLRRRAGLIACLLVTVVGTRASCSSSGGSMRRAVDLHDLLWTGKGIDSGWGGLEWGKAWMMLAASAAILVALGTDATPVTAQHAVLPLVAAGAGRAGDLHRLRRVWWQHRGDPRLRAIAVVFLGTLAAGEVLNLYSQPHDPQMQVNVMAWLTVAWALLLWRARSHAHLRALAVLSFVPLISTRLVRSLARRRRRGRGRARHPRAAFPPDRTVFVYWGFEAITMWQYALWSHTWDWDGKPNDAKFKWIAIDAGAIRHVGWTPSRTPMSSARSRGRLRSRLPVVISDVWTWSEAQLAGNLSALSASDRAPAIHAMLHRYYEATPVLEVPAAGTYYELRRR